MLLKLRAQVASLDNRQRLALLLVVAAGATFAAWSIADRERTIELTVPTGRIRVVLADTPQRRAAGLSRRDQVPADGMLLVWDAAGRHPIWMFEMRFPLDLVWLDVNGRVLGMLSNVAPCTQEPCALYELETSEAVAVLELPAGRAMASGISVGTVVYGRNDARELWARRSSDCGLCSDD